MSMPALSPMQIASGRSGSRATLPRRMLARLPDEHFGWKPHEKSMSLGALGAHLANVLTWLDITLKHGGFDTATTPPPREVPQNREALLTLFDQNATVLREALAQADMATLAEPWTLRHGDHVIVFDGNFRVKAHINLC